MKQKSLKLSEHVYALLQQLKGILYEENKAKVTDTFVIEHALNIALEAKK